MSSHPASHTYRVSSAIIEQCLIVAENRGIQRERLLQDAMLVEDDIRSHDGWADIEKIEPLLRLCIERMQDPLIGLHVIPNIIFAMGLVGFAMQASSTLQELIETNIRLEPLLGDIGKTSISHAPGAVLWQWRSNIKDPVVVRHVHECVLGCQVSAIRIVSQRESQPLVAVHFLHDAPNDPAIKREIENFFGCPILYKQPCSELVLKSASLKKPLNKADPTLHETLENILSRNLHASMHEEGICDKAHSYMLGQLNRGEIPSRASLAKLFEISERHLHRRLQDSGTSFREAFDRVRLEVATDLLKNKSLSVDIISAKLGFKESQSFIRWFRRHTSTTPGGFRHKHKS